MREQPMNASTGCGRGLCLMSIVAVFVIFASRVKVMEGLMLLAGVALAFVLGVILMIVGYLQDR